MLADLLNYNADGAVIVWVDVDESSFMAFIQFAYLGDYSVPRMIVQAEAVNLAEPAIEPRIPTPPDSPGPDPLIDEDVFGNFGMVHPKTSSKKYKKRKKSAYISTSSRVPEEDDLPPPIEFTAEYAIQNPKPERRADISQGIDTLEQSRLPPKFFKALNYSILKPRNTFKDTCDPTMGETQHIQEENIGQVLQLHASLYRLACKWEVGSLKNLSLSKLHKTLCMLNLKESKLQYILDLVRYVYSSNEVADLGNETDKLRELICLYIVDYSVLVSESEEFMVLFEEGGAFPRDLWKLVASRVASE